MSGGIDSTATCLMLQERGYEIVGVTMRVWGDEPQDARELAAQMGIEHYVADERIPFKETIVKNFIDEYKQGRTPNPCVMCNPLFKFRVLTEWADKLGCAWVATGHYSRLEERNGDIYIVAGDDDKKDQSYFLWQLGQDVLRRCIFPLGDYTKVKATENAEPQWAVACISVYLTGMLSSYISSTWYHGTRPGKTKELLRKFDHGAIYLHIAGTYTPFTLLVLRQAGGWGWGIFAFVWLSAIAGFILSFKKLKEHSNLETCCYVAMGASILVAMKPLMDHLALLNATPAFWWLIGGGVSYITGAVFYSLRKPYMHATFHLFCLGGSIGHIIAIWLIL